MQDDATPPTDEAFPVGIAMSPANELQISWNDGSTRVYQPAELQRQCPCANCAEKHGPPAAAKPSPFAVMNKAEAEPLRIVDLAPVGNYAYAIRFNHGCSRGIWRIELLRTLGRDVTD